MKSRVTEGSQSGRARRSGRGEASKLAPRETEALGHIARGLTHAQTARRMGVRESTVDTYVKRIREKLKVGNKAELTRKAMELALIPRPPGTGQERRAADPPGQDRDGGEVGTEASPG